MPTTIDTTTQVSSPGWSNQRKIVDVNGPIVVAVNSAADNRWEFWTDPIPGVSAFAEITALRLPFSATAAPSGSLFIDGDLNLHFVHSAASGGSAGDVRYQFCSAAGSYSSWTTAVTVATGAFTPDVVAHRFGVSWVAHVIAHGTLGDPYARVDIDGSGNVIVTSTSLAMLTSTTAAPSIDFAHIGDGRTAQSVPNVYVVGTVSGGTVYRKLVYSAGLWTPSTVRTIAATGSGTANRTSSCFDGSRTIIAWVPSGANTTIKVAQRDAADTATVNITDPPALSDGQVIGLSVTTDTSGDIIVAAVGTTSGDPKYVIYNRATATWGTWQTIEATTVAVDSITTRRAVGYNLDVVYATGASSPYTLRWQRVAIAVTPNGAPWVTADGAQDVAAALPLDWTFSSPNPSDTQASYVLKRDIGGTIRYYRASDQTWQTTEQINVDVNSNVTLASSWGLDADANHLYYVKTTSAAGSTGPFGPALTVTPSAKVNPTLDEPDPGDVVSASTATLQWTVATQSAYRALITDTGTSAVMWESGWVASTALRQATSTAVLVNGGSYTASIQTKNTEGLASTAATAAFTVAYTAPATPSLDITLTASTPAPRLQIVNPTPSGGQPTVTSQDLYVRVITPRADGERPVGGAGIRIATGLAAGSVYIDWAAASDVNYEYMVVSYGDNGGVATSAWISASTTVTSRLLLTGAVGGGASTPDGAALDVVGDLEVVVGAQLADWSSGANQVLVAKYNSASQISFALFVSATGVPQLIWSANGIATVTATATAAVPFGNLVDGMVKATLAINVAGQYNVKFYRALNVVGDPTLVAWVQLGSTVVGATGPTSIFNSTTPVTIGYPTASGALGPATGTIYLAAIRNGIGGTLVASPDFRIQTPGATSFVDGQGNTWTVVSPAALVAAA